MSIGPGPLPWHVDISHSPSGETVKIIDANGGVAALMKGPRKRENARLIVEAVNPK